MKWLFYAFLIANLLVFGFASLGGDRGAVGPRSREINASQVLIAGSIPPIPKVASAASAVASAVAEAASAVSASKPEAAVASASSAALCLRWSGFSIEQAAIGRERIKALGLTATEQGSSDKARVWVYIPPLDTLEQARKKAQQLADLGIDDYFVVNDGSKWRNAVSLGIFSSKEAGERRLADLRAKGVKSAVVRDKDDNLKLVSFLFKNISEENRQKLDKAGSGLRGVELREAACR